MRPLIAIIDIRYFASPKFSAKKAYTSADSSIIVEVGSPEPWPARLSAQMSTGLSP